MNFSLQDKPCSNQMADSWFPTAVISHFYSAVYVDYHNNISERGLRPFAASRKILYGNRSERGAERTKILMSVYETCKMRGVNFYQFTKDCLEGKATEIPAGHTAVPAAAAA